MDSGEGKASFQAFSLEETISLFDHLVDRLPAQTLFENEKLKALFDAPDRLKGPLTADQRKNAELVSQLGDVIEQLLHGGEVRGNGDDVTTAAALLDESLNAMAQGMLIHDHEKIIRSNQQMATMLDLPAALIAPGALMNDFISFCVERGDEGENANLETVLQRSKEKCLAGEPFTVERKVPNGNIIVANVQPRQNGGGVTTYTDVTEERKRQQELEDARSAAQSADRAKSEFLANMSHEIRTPMNGVMGMAELLARTELDARQKVYADVIIKSGSSLLTIINDILDFSKLDAKQMELDPSPFKLTDAIEDVATLVSSRVAEKNLELIVRVDPALPDMLVGDVGRIRQIVTNLMSNAVKFTDKGHVYVDVSGGPAAGSMYRLHVKIEDTGVGIAKEKCDNVFEKFSQVDNSATRKHEGTGLGLAISSSLIELMGGAIGVESALGEGSTFWFTIELPVHHDEEKQKSVPRDVTGSHILIIDDNKVNRAILEEQMAAWKFACTSCEDGRAGLDFMREAIKQGRNIDCIVLDYQMPGMSGGDVVREMKADGVLKELPIVMLTSVDQTEDGRMFSSLGINGQLTKPARSSLLLETIIQALQQNQPARVKHDTRSLALESDHLPPVAEISAAPNIKAIDILVCEDNEVNQIVFTQILQTTDYSFKIAKDGKEGLAFYKTYSPRLVLMDISMPHMNGMEATKAIRTIEAGNMHTPIVAVTAHAIKGDMEKCIASGMDDYLSKPISPDRLEEKIHYWLDKSKADVA